MNAITQLDLGRKSAKGRPPYPRKAGCSLTAPDIVARQAQFNLRAFQAFADRIDALRFLNSYDVQRGFRPIDLAGQDYTGLNAATRYLAASMPSSIEPPA